MATALAPVTTWLTETFTTPTGQALEIHAAEVCRGPCPVHMPTGHHLRCLALHWNVERARFERVCDHGVHHPDPDVIAVVRRDRGGEAAGAASMHVCDGCCARA
jgi:hypothetical protein